jgi:hypothetical protein
MPRFVLRKGKCCVIFDCQLGATGGVVSVMNGFSAGLVVIVTVGAGGH